jgi:hypothetical protein
VCGRDSAGNSICVPSICNSCDHGCSFSCPAR